MLIWLSLGLVLIPELFQNVSPQIVAALVFLWSLYIADSFVVKLTKVEKRQGIAALFFGDKEVKRKESPGAI